MNLLIAVVSLLILVGFAPGTSDTPVSGRVIN